MLIKSQIGASSLIVTMACTLTGCEVAEMASYSLMTPPPACQEIIYGNLDKAKQLYSEGADPNEDHGCALNASASRGLYEMTQYLLDRGARPNRIVSKGILGVARGPSPLKNAVISRDIRLVQLLLEHDADPREDFEAFEVVLNFGDVAMAELLLDYGANPDMLSESGESEHAFLDGEMVEVSSQDLVPERIDETAVRLQCAIGRGNFSILHSALSGGPGGDGRDQIAKILLDRGANPNVRDLNGATPLMYASRRGELSLVKKLLEVGAEADAQDRCERTVMDYASNPKVKAILLGTQG